MRISSSTMNFNSSRTSFHSHLNEENSMRPIYSLGDNNVCRSFFLNSFNKISTKKSISFFSELPTISTMNGARSILRLAA